MTALPIPAAPLDQPQYGATFRQAFARFFRKYAVFTGRASQSELWWSVLLTNVLVLAACIPMLLATAGQLVAVLNASMTAAAGATPEPTGILGWSFGVLLGILPVFVVSFGLLVPTYAVAVRRLHDAGLSGWLVLLALVSGSVFLIVVGLLPSKIEGLRYEEASGSAPVLPPGIHVPGPYGGMPAQPTPPGPPAW